MVQLSLLALAAASVAPLASADTCKTGINYCGYNLREIGSYTAEIKEQLWKHGYEDTWANINSRLYTCGVGGKGWIGLIQICKECRDGGAGKSDWCGGSDRPNYS